MENRDSCNRIPQNMELFCFTLFSLMISIISLVDRIHFKNQ